MELSVEKNSMEISSGEFFDFFFNHLKKEIVSEILDFYFEYNRIPLTKFEHQSRVRRAVAGANGNKLDLWNDKNVSFTNL